ncbi:zinc finger MYM-type protein 1-like [Anneissia japonica]|uniref:zinc finger MYM-type protein 1-like n=1 Tax=Anneissia japonica TaxID=1529436 RepID=UPI00142578CE|nr:zinc finger MYM-type protein 1-like [Anneissia japonica]
MANSNDNVLPNEPHHPKADFSFPKRSFGKAKPVMCSAQSQWFRTWPFLHYVEGKDVVFCHTCVAAVKQVKLKFSNSMASAFVTKGFSNWKDATTTFRKHQQSKTHGKAVEVVLTLPKATKKVGELQNGAHSVQKEKARDMLLLILSSIRFLARQGLALRGDGSDASSNLIQLLTLRADDQPDILQWIHKSACKHTSPENQNEMLKLMAHQVLRQILQQINSSPFFTVMADGNTDRSNRVKLTLVIRWVNDNFVVSEECLGLYYLSATNAKSIVNAIKDTITLFKIPLTKLRGQCYDGCSNMAGAKAGVATMIQKIEPRAVFMHCYGHALNFAVGETIKQSKTMKDCLDTCYELLKFIKFSPKREAMLRDLKEELVSDTPNVQTLCPTRWTVCAGDLASILANYDSIQLLWEAALCATPDTEMKARIRGVESQMQKFKFLFGLVLSELILRHTDKLSQTLQQPNLSSVEGHEVAMLTMKTLQGIQSDPDGFNLFWESLELLRCQLDVDEPHLERKRKAPRWFEEVSAPGEFPVSVKDEYRRVYFEAFDHALNSIQSRFDQKGFKTFSKVEQLLFKACVGECFSHELDEVCTFFYDDFDKDELKAELITLHQLYDSTVGKEAPSINNIRKTMLTLSSSQMMLIKTASRLFQLLLILPATNTTSELSFSSLRRIKSYLSCTMEQDRLNHLMILHNHQDLCDSLDLKTIANEYIAKNETRKNVFATFK